MLEYDIYRSDKKEKEKINVENAELLIKVINTKFKDMFLIRLFKKLKNEYPNILTYLPEINNAIDNGNLSKLREYVLDLKTYMDRVKENLSKDITSILSKVDVEKDVSVTSFYTVETFLKYTYLALEPEEFKIFLSYLD